MKEGARPGRDGGVLVAGNDKGKDKDGVVLGDGDKGKGGSKVEEKGAKEIENSVKMKLVRIAAGKFKMGSPEGEEGRHGEEHLHEVTISKLFFIGAYEATQQKWRR